MNKIKLSLMTLLIAGFVSASHSETNYNNKGLSIGPNLGYSTIEQKSNLINVISSSPSVGVHLDYHYPTSETLFMGVGYSFNHLPGGGEYDRISTSSMRYAMKDYSQSQSIKTKGYSDFYAQEFVSEEVSYENLPNLLSHKKNSHYLTLRVGKFLSGNISANANLSIVISEFNTGGVGKTKDFYRYGIAPGLGLTLHFDEKLSGSLNYMYEIYGQNNGSSRPKINVHNFFTKLSYKI